MNSQARSAGVRRLRSRSRQASSEPKQTKRKPAAAKLKMLAAAPEDLREMKSRSEFVYERLCDAISEGQIPQGMRLREEEIARKLGVSRTPVREALRRLQARGLLTVGAGRSLMIAELSTQQVLELYAMREILEGSAARFAAQRAGEADVALLRRLHREFMDAWDRPEKLVPINRRFHQAIYEAAHNRYLTQALNELHDAFALLHSNTFRIPDRPQDSNTEHLEIIRAIAAHDADRAERAARKHIKLAQQTRFG